MPDININNNKKTYSLYHHELLDRVYTIFIMYNNLIMDHENSDDILSHEEKEQMSFVLGDLYQMVGERIAKMYGEYINEQNN